MLLHHLIFASYNRHLKINHGVSLGTDHPSKQQPSNFSVPQGTGKPNKSHQENKKPWKFQYGWLDIIKSNLLSYSQFCPIFTNRSVPI